MIGRTQPAPPSYTRFHLISACTSAYPKENLNRRSSFSCLPSLLCTVCRLKFLTKIAKTLRSPHLKHLRAYAKPKCLCLACFPAPLLLRLSCVLSRPLPKRYKQIDEDFGGGGGGAPVLIVPSHLVKSTCPSKQAAAEAAPSFIPTSRRSSWSRSGGPEKDYLRKPWGLEAMPSQSPFRTAA